VRSGNLTEGDVRRHPGEEAEHDRDGDEAGETSQPECASRQHDGAGEHGEQDECGWAVGAVDAAERRPRCERSRGGGRDHHQPGACRKAASDRACEARVKSVDRADADEHRRRHPVGNAPDRTRNTGESVASDRTAIGRNRTRATTK
jgi:hypothetical protein